MQSPKSLKSKRLLLESLPPLTHVVRTMVGWLNDPVITQYSEQRHKKHTIASQVQYLKDNPLLWGIYEMPSGHLIGSITAHYDEPNDVADIGLMIGDTENMGKGYGYEAWETLCNGLPVRKIEAGCMEINRPMMSICSKYGMMEEGRREDHFVVGDTTCDLVLWGKCR